MTLGQGLQIGPFTFTVLRLLIAVGLIRAVLRKERPSTSSRLDRLIFFFAVTAVISSAFHEPKSEALTYRLGLAYNVFGIYYLIRCFCTDRSDMEHLACMLAIVLVPVSLEMLQEQVTGRNLFAVLGGVPDAVYVRSGRLRAQGPFAHPILAGTVGAVALPLVIGIWRQHRTTAIIALCSCILIVLASASSGPLMSAIFGAGAVAAYRFRHNMARIRITALLIYLLLELVMTAPAYFLIARIDLTGSSTGWHRAQLIQASLDHLDEWWFAGTDYTRHWMPTGVSATPNHTDLTNHYIANGVLGGLPLMLLFIAALWEGFRLVGRATASLTEDNDSAFLPWCFGAALFAHAATSVSVSYFDQSFIFLYITLAALAAFANPSIVASPAIELEHEPHYG